MKKINRDSKFPHPVQGLEYNIWEDIKIEYSDRVLSMATCDETPLRKIDNTFRLAYSISINDSYIDSLVESNKAQIVLELDCPATMYRYCQIETEKEFSVEIPEYMVFDNFSITITVIAAKKIDDYNNPNEDEDFTDLGDFSLNKGDVLSYVFYKRYYLKQAARVESFIAIEPYKTESKPDVSYLLSNPSILIRMPQEMYNTLNNKVYRSQETKNRYLPLVMGSVINEALIYAIINIKEKGNWERPWAKAIRTWVDIAYEEDFIWGDNNCPVNVEDAIAISHGILSNPYRSIFEQIEILKTR